MFDKLIFLNLWALLLLPLPLLMALLMPVYKGSRRSLKVSFLPQLKSASGIEVHKKQAVSSATLAQKILLLLLWLLLILALTKPQYIEAPIIKEHSQRDLLIAVDLSGSMETEDFTTADGNTINRLQAVKNILKPFFEQRKGERIGLVFFGSAAFVQAPFTTDLAALQALLTEAQVAMAGPKTVIGDSIAMAVKMFDESKVEDRLLLLLTDGNDTGSRVPPEEAARFAKENNIKIIAIAIGDPENAGENPIDSKTLKSIAKKTGGQFYYALDNKALDKVLQEINRLSPKKVKRESYNPTRELYLWPLAIAFFLILFYNTLIVVFKTGNKS